MPRTLTITYGDIQLYKGDVDKITWTDSDTVIGITAELAKKSAAGGGLGALADLIAQASKQKTADKSHELAQQQTHDDTVKGPDTNND